MKLKIDIKVNSKIGAIWIFKEVYALGLREARDIVEAIVAGDPLVGELGDLNALMIVSTRYSAERVRHVCLDSPSPAGSGSALACQALEFTGVTEAQFIDLSQIARGLTSCDPVK